MAVKAVKVVLYMTHREKNLDYSTQTTISLGNLKTNFYVLLAESVYIDIFFVIVKRSVWNESF